MATIIVNENTFKRLLAHEMVNEEMSKRDIVDAVKGDRDIENRIKEIVRNTLKNDSEVERARKENTSNTIRNDKELEKRIKNIVADVLVKYNKTLWQRSSFIDSEIRN